MTEVRIYASKARTLEIAEQIRKAAAEPDDGGRFETVVYAQHNSNSKGEVVLTFSNDDSEPDDGGYQGNGVIVDIDED